MYSEDTLRVYAVPQQSGGLCDTYNNTSQVDCVTCTAKMYSATPHQSGGLCDMHLLLLAIFISKVDSP